jgi:type II secretory pathway pseudopilin PulG
VTKPRHHVRTRQSRVTFGKPKARTGLTLTELLVSVAIMVVLVAAAVPILKPLNASSKNREAARQVQALFAEARGMAALRGRPVGVMLDTSLDPRVADDVEDRDAVTRLYIAEVPPMFQGTLPGSCVVASDPRTPADISNGFDADPPPVMQAFNSGDGGATNPFQYLYFFASPIEFSNVLNNVGGSTVDTTLDALIPMGSAFRIRFGGTGPWYDGIREIDHVVPPSSQTATRRVALPGNVQSARFRIQAAGVTTLDRPSLKPAWFPPDQQVLTSLNLLSSPTNQPYTLGAAIRPPTNQALKYQILLPPQRVGTSALELPNGAVVDLRCSGFGRSEYGLGQNLPAENPVVLFSQNGSIDSFSGIKANAALHLLVGTRKQMAKLNEPALIGGARVTSFTNGTLTNNTAYGNLRDGSSVWVTINNRTGAAATSDVGVIPAMLNLGGQREFNPTGDPTGAPLNAELVRRNAILSAREFANTLNAKGGL